VGKVVAEERKRLDERAAPGHDLGASAREQVERRELLEHANRIVRAEDAHRARQTNRLRASSRCAEHDCGCRYCEVRTVMLADTEDVEADLVCELDLLEQVAQPLFGGYRAVGELCKGVNAKLDCSTLTVRSSASTHRASNAMPESSRSSASASS